MRRERISKDMDVQIEQHGVGSTREIGRLLLKKIKSGTEGVDGEDPLSKDIQVYEITCRRHLIIYRTT